MRTGAVGVLWVALALAAGGIGSRWLPGEWYAALDKPTWTPPDAVFAPVWTALYVLMGIAAWLVWLRCGLTGAPLALGFFVGQLVLNALWSYLFFGLQRPDLAFAEIVLLWGSILVTTLLFGSVRSLAGVLLLPYLLWVGYASALNFSIWRLNR